MDSESHRTYKVKYKVKTATTEGPASVLSAAGLPLYGSIYFINNDIDIWAWCRWDAEVQPFGPSTEGEPFEYYTIDLTFSSKPPAAGDKPKSCKDQKTDDPLLEPMKISGAFANEQVEASTDRKGKPILNSGWERIRGQEVMFDQSRPTVEIEQNVASLQLDLISSFQDCLNDDYLWGLPPRTIKLSRISWEQRFYGVCFKYYTRKFGFDIRFEGWDRDIPDESCMVLNGQWTSAGVWSLININGIAPDPKNPNHFIRWKDKRGENYRGLLDGKGQPATAPVYYISTINGNLNLPPTTTPAAWTPIIDVQQYEWDSTATYEVGNIIKSIFDLRYYLAIQASTGAEPPSSSFWLDLGPSGANYKGYWKKNFLGPSGTYSSAGYKVGDTVVVRSGLHNPGRIHVEKYLSGNFLLLGIPTVL